MQMELIMIVLSSMGNERNFINSFPFFSFMTQKDLFTDDLASYKDIIIAASFHLNNLNNNLYYHGKNHTIQMVLPSALELAKAEKFSPRKRELMVIAAAFHDTGFKNVYMDNEPLGATFAAEYMAIKREYSLEEIYLVKSAIEHTSLSQKPQNLFEKVLRDADLSYLGKDYLLFEKWNENLRKESLEYPGSPLHESALSMITWSKSTLDFMEMHQWFTGAAQVLYGSDKEFNRKLLVNDLESYVKAEQK